MTKNKAFTIVELLLVLILISLTMGIGIYAFDIVKQQIVMFMKERKAAYEERELKYFLRADITRSNSVTLSLDSTLTTINEHDTVFYELKSGRIIRRAGQVEFFYPFVVEQLDAVRVKKDLVRKVVLRLSHPTPSTIVLRKEYSSEEMIESRD